MPWTSYRRTPLGHHGFGRRLTHPGAGWVTRFWDRRLTPLADEFSSSQVGSLPYSVTKHAAVALAEWCGVWVGWFGWLDLRKARFFFVKKMGDSWDRPVSGLNVFPAKVGNTTWFFGLDPMYRKLTLWCLFWKIMVTWSLGHMVRLEVS